MENLFIFGIKSSGLVVLFYLTYYFMLRKETFFNSNRWFLITGLLTSVVLPLVVITKIVWVNPSPQVISWSKIPITKTIENEVFEINWFLVFGIFYLIGFTVFLLKFAFDFYSLTKIFNGKTIQHQADYKYIAVTENLAPFSYFNYIVYNPALYSAAELENILEHEKVHSAQNHTVDVLISRLFCIVFWFNPFVWIYKKAIIQNLEYIADSEAIKNISDKKAYQFTLLKITTHENCVAITNHFYQSLIKKRIVMLNKNQSNKRNFWKYAIVFPALVAFVLLFQVKVVAQEKEAKIEQISGMKITEIVTDKNSTDEEIKANAKTIKEQNGITLKFSNIKRNSNGEITGIKVQYKDKEGNSGVNQFNGNEPIKPIHFYKTDTSIGFGKPNDVRIVSVHEFKTPEDAVYAYEYSGNKNTDNQEDINVEINDTEGSENPEAPELPQPPENPDTKIEKKIIIKSGANGKAKPIIIINGKRVDNEDAISDIDPEDINSVNILKGNQAIKMYGSSGKNGAIEIITLSSEGKIKGFEKKMKMHNKAFETLNKKQEIDTLAFDKELTSFEKDIDDFDKEMGTLDKSAKKKNITIEKKTIKTKKK